MLGLNAPYTELGWIPLRTLCTRAALRPRGPSSAGGAGSAPVALGSVEAA